MWVEHRWACQYFSWAFLNNSIHFLVGNPGGVQGLLALYSGISVRSARKAICNVVYLTQVSCIQSKNLFTYLFDLITLIQVITFHFILINSFNNCFIIHCHFSWNLLSRFCLWRSTDVVLTEVQVHEFLTRLVL